MAEQSAIHTLPEESIQLKNCVLLVGMIPHKTKRGAEAMNRLKVFDGVPPPYDKVSKLKWLNNFHSVKRLSKFHVFLFL